MKRLGLAAILLLAAGPAFACPSPLTGKDAAGTTQNFGVTLDGSANCYGNIAIVDGSNAANKATVTAGNALKVDGSAVTQPVSGTVTANQGGAPWSVSQSGNWTARVVGNAGGVFDFAGQNAAQPANSVLIGGEFNTTPTTIVSGNASPLQLDSSGNLLVNLKANSFGTITVSGTVTATQGTSPEVDNITQFGGTNLSTGTGASGAGIPRVTVSNDSNILATQSGVWNVNQAGTWTVQQGTPPWAVTNQQSNVQLDYDTGAGTQNLTIWGIALPASGGAVAGGTATNPIRIDPTGTTTQPVSGTVTANAGSGTFTVSGTVTANQGGAPWSQNVTQFGSVNISTGTGASGTGIPRVTVANDSNILATQSGTWTVQQGGAPWSVSQSGNWTTRIVGNVGGILDAAGQNASSPANELLVAGQFNTTPTTITSGNVSPLQVDTNGNLLVNVKVGGGTGGTSSSFGSAFPGTGTAIGVKNGANMVNLAADGSSNLLVNCAVGCGASGFADLGAFSLGVSNVNVMAGIYEAVPAPVASGQGAAAMITANRALFVNHRDSAGQELGASLPGQVNAPVRVATGPAFTLPTATVLQPIDPMGQPRAAAMITDGTKYAALTAPNTGPTAAQPALVVSPSPNSTTTVTGTVAVTQSTTPWRDNLQNSVGQEIGSSLSSANNIPLQVTQSVTLQARPGNILTPLDAYGNQMRTTILADGQHYADIVPAGLSGVSTASGALVVVASPKLSLQCPFTVGINQTASTQIVTNPGNKSLHICGFGFVSASAQNVSLVEGTGSTCATGTGALVGGTSSSIAAAANGGLWNMTDRITIPMQKPGDHLCVLQSAAGNVSGTLTYGVF